MSSCVSRQVLEQFLTGELPSDQASRVCDHITECESCRATLQTLSDDPVLHEFIRPTGTNAAATVREPEIRAVLERVRRMSPPQDAQAAVTTTDPKSLEFLDPSDQPDELGVLGHYRVLAELGRGGMGIVYKAFDTELQRTVAIKVLLPDRADANSRERFVREAQAAARLNHDNIVPVYSVSNPEGGLPYFAMEYVDGQSLKERIEKDQQLNSREAVRICMQVAHALAAAHQASLAHRDVKPGNVLLDAVSGRAKITDFGLVRPTDATKGITQEGTIPGTPEYMSPEQIRDPNRIDARSDIYSLGVTLYESLTGEVPFRGVPHMVLQQVLNDEPRPSRRLNDAIPRDVETICLKAMAKNASGRYQTAKQMADDLRRWLDGEPIHARPVGSLERVYRWAKRNPRIAAPTAALLLSLVFAASGAMVGMVVINHHRHVAEQGRRDAEAARAEEAIQRQTAQQAQRLAEESAELARNQSALALETLESVIFDIQDGLDNVAGAGPMRRSLLRTVLERLHRVSNQYLTRAAVERNTVVSLGKLGDLYLQFGIGKTGAPGLAADERREHEMTDDAQSLHPDELNSVASAVVLYKRALEIADELASTDLTNTEAQLDLSICYRRLGDVSLRLQQIESARANYQNAMLIRERLAATKPSSAEALQSLAVAYDRMGDVMLWMDQSPGAIAYYQKALEARQTLATADPSSTSAQHDLSVSHVKLGDLNLRVQQIQTALGHYQEASNILRKLAAASPDDRSVRRDLSAVYGSLGIGCLQARQVQEAAEYCEEAWNITQQLASDDPTDLQAQRDLSISYEHMGIVSRVAGDLDKALECYKQSWEICRKLSALDPTDVRAQRDLAMSSVQIGEVCLQAGQIQDGLGYYQMSLEIRLNLAAADPNNTRKQVALSQSYEDAGDACFRVGRTREGLDYYEKWLETVQDTANAHPADADKQRHLWLSHVKLGEIISKIGRTHEAQGYYTKALRIAREQADAKPDDRRAQRDLMVSYDRLARENSRSREVLKARENYYEALTISQKLAAFDPTDAEAEMSLCGIHLGLASIEQEAKQYTQAVDWYKKGLAILKKLDGEGRLPADQRQLIEAAEVCIEHCLKQHQPMEPN